MAKELCAGRAHSARREYPRLAPMQDAEGGGERHNEDGGEGGNGDL